MNEKIEKKTLRSFGLLVGGIFAAISLWPYLIQQAKITPWAAILASALVLSSILLPGLLAWPYRAWIATGHALGWVNSRLILGIIFYLLFTPLAIVMRLFGYDAMARRFDQSVESYRIAVALRKPEHMEKQF